MRLYDEAVGSRCTDPGCRCQMSHVGDGWRLGVQQGETNAGRAGHTIATYNRGCRCDECREAARVYRAKYRARQA